MYDNSPSMHDTKMTGPGVQYVFRNYGKSPAILDFAMHGSFIDKGLEQMRTLIPTDGALEVIGVDGESPINTVTYTEPFKFGDARALVTEDAVLFFYGEATYTDAFGGRVKLEWEFIADGGESHSEAREEREASEIRVAHFAVWRNQKTDRRTSSVGPRQSTGLVDGAFFGRAVGEGFTRLERAQ